VPWQKDHLAPALAAGAALGAAGFLAWAVRGRSSPVFGPVIWRGPGSRRALALTFDDGPSESTPQLLETLARHNARATFFMLGANVERLPEVAREVARAGHEIGNHGYAHPLYAMRSPRFIAEDMARGQAAIEQACGVTPKLFRPPFGARWFGCRRAQRELGLVSVTWTAIGYDWKLAAGPVVERISQAVVNGAILCLHDGRELRAKPDVSATLEAVACMVPALVGQGYELETVSTLIWPRKNSRNGF
jgi:peptidoglycan-N-acetylglucosamine deacetylase